MIASARALIRAIDTFYNFLSHGLLLRRENTQREKKQSNWKYEYFIETCALH